MDMDKAIRITHPNVATILGDEEAWDQDGNVVELDEAKIATELARLQAEYDSQEYARKRKAEYDKLNQFEMQFDDQRDGTSTWADAINAIKAKYSKP